jgi:tetratricopeptide (TPR) repeat protein
MKTVHIRSRVMILYLLAIVFTAARTEARITKIEHDSLRQIGLEEYRMGHYSQAETWILRALELAQRNKDEYAAAIDYSLLGDIFQAKGQFTEAERTYRKAISILPHRPETTNALSIVWSNLAAALTAEARFEEALRDLNEASKLIVHAKLKDPKLEAQVFNTCGVIFFYQGKMRKAETCFLQASYLGVVADTPLDVDLGETLNNLGRVYQSMRQYAKAEDIYKRSLRLVEARYGYADPNVTPILDNLGSLYISTRRYKEAESLFQRSVAILEDAGLTNERLMMQTLHGLGKTYLAEHDTPRAEPFLARAAEIVRKTTLHPTDRWEAVEVLETYFKALTELSQPLEAERVQAEARRIRASMAFTVRVR